MGKRVELLSWESMQSIPVGGIAVHLTELADALGRRGHEVHVFTRIGPGQTRYSCIGGVHYHRCPFDPNADLMTYVRRMGEGLCLSLLRVADCETRQCVREGPEP